ncbi:Extracellular serine protease precursor [compost metagenome]
MAFAGGGAFSVSGVPVARNTAVLELGLDMALQRNLTLGLAYSGQAGSDYREQGVKAQLLWKF